MSDYIGKIRIDSGHVLVSDPCYSIGTWCTGSAPVVPGKYLCYAEIKDIEDAGKRVCSIAIVHESVKSLDEIDEFTFNRARDQTIGVDSGTCGIYEAEWYDKNRDGLLKDIDFLKDYVLYEKGFTCHAGFGDGSYDMYTVKNDSGIVAIRVIFIDNE